MQNGNMHLVIAERFVVVTAQDGNLMPSPEAEL